jgi:biotin operon repressor
MGYTIVYPLILEMLRKRTGEIINTADICAELSITEKQVRGGIRTLTGHGHDIEIIGRGYAYAYRGAGKTATTIPTVKGDKRLFEEIGMSKQGVIIQDVQGVLYIAKEL